MSMETTVQPTQPVSDDFPYGHMYTVAEVPQPAGESVWVVQDEAGQVDRFLGGFYDSFDACVRFLLWLAQGNEGMFQQ